MTRLDHTNATWADGPAVMAWLDAHADVRPTTPMLRRRLERWRAGAQASFWHIDELLCGLGLHVSQLPDGVWRPYDNGRAKRVPGTAVAVAVAA